LTFNDIKNSRQIDKVPNKKQQPRLKNTLFMAYN
jgi:hypothetical protein